MLDPVPEYVFIAVLFEVNSSIETVLLMPNTHRRRRRDATVELSRVGVGGVYWALNVTRNSVSDKRSQGACPSPKMPENTF